MRPTRLEINAVRGLREFGMPLRPFTTLIGPNNAGKSSVLDAIRLFYGDLEWDAERDSPWNGGGDPYVEVGYELDSAEAYGLDFHADGSCLTVRRYFAHGDTFSGPYAAGQYYTLAAPPSQVSGPDIELTPWPEPEIGSCVYVPATSRLDDQVTSGGRSPLQEMTRLALRDPATAAAIQETSSGLAKLRAALTSANGAAAWLESRLTPAVDAWGLQAVVGVNDLTEDIVVDHLIELGLLKDGRVTSIDQHGTGVQRALLAALIQASADLAPPSSENTKLHWVLFEEPEAYLHPSQVGRLGDDLARLATTRGTTVTATTHDPTLLAAHGHLDAIVRLSESRAGVRASAPSAENWRNMLNGVRKRGRYTDYARKGFDPRRPPRRASRAQTAERIQGDLDARRAAAFFADRVIVVEGYSDCALFEWLSRRGLLEPLGANVGIIDASGKYDLHKVISVLSLFGIPHALLWDEDAALPTTREATRLMRARQDEAAWQAIRDAVRFDGTGVPGVLADSTVGGIRLSGTIESWLGINEEGENAWKAANLANALDDAFEEADAALPTRLRELVSLLADMFDGKPLGIRRNSNIFQGCLIAPPFPAATAAFDDVPTG